MAELPQFNDRQNEIIQELNKRMQIDSLQFSHKQRAIIRELNRRSQENILDANPEFKKAKEGFFDNMIDSISQEGKNVIESSSTYAAKFYGASGNFFAMLNSWRKFLEKNIGLEKFIEEKTGVKTGGLFTDLAKDQFEISKWFADRGIDENATGFAGIARKFYGALGAATFDLPVIRGLGLPTFSALMGGAEAIENEESVLKGVTVGALHGVLLHGILKSANILPRKTAISVNGLVFGGLSLLEELEKPAEERDYEKVIADFFVGAGLSLTTPNTGKTRQELVNDFKRSIGLNDIKEASVFLKESVETLGKFSSKELKRAEQEMFQKDTEIGRQMADALERAKKKSFERQFGELEKQERIQQKLNKIQEGEEVPKIVKKEVKDIVERIKTRREELSEEEFKKGFEREEKEIPIKTVSPSGFDPLDTISTKPELSKNKTFAWRSMGIKEFEKLTLGEKEYSGDKAATGGNFLASVPESAAKSGGKNKILVEFANIHIRGNKGLLPGTKAGRGNVVRVWEYNVKSKTWEEAPELLNKIEKNISEGFKTKKKPKEEVEITERPEEFDLTAEQRSQQDEIISRTSGFINRERAADIVRGENIEKNITESVNEKIRDIEEHGRVREMAFNEAINAVEDITGIAVDRSKIEISVKVSPLTDRINKVKQDIENLSGFPKTEGTKIRMQKLKSKLRELEDQSEKEPIEEIKNKEVFSDAQEPKAEKSGENISNKDRIKRKQRKIFALIDEKGITKEDLNVAIKGVGINDLKFTGEKAMTESQMDVIIERLSKVNPGWTKEEKFYYMSRGVEPPNTPPSGGTMLAEEGPADSRTRRAFRGFQLKFLQTVETSLRKFGKTGEEIADRVLNAHQESASRTSIDIKRVKSIFKPLSPKETRLLVRSYSNPDLINTFSEKLLKARRDFDTFTSEYGDIAQLLLIKTITRTGKKVPFIRRTNYFPRVFDFDFLANKRNEARIIKRIMKEKKISKAEAKAELKADIDEMIRLRRTHNIEPNLEYERVFDAPGWLGDPDSPVSGRKYKKQVILGLERYIAGANRRFSEQKYFDEGGTQVFGKDYKTLNQLVRSEANDDIRRFYQDAIRRIRGIEGSEMEASILRSIKNYQVLRRLGLASIGNFFQTTITVLPKAATLGYVRAFSIMYHGTKDTLSRSGRSYAEDVGAINEQTMREVVGLSGRGVLGKAATIFMKYLTPFATTENLNNIFAANVGRVYFSRLVKIVSGADKPIWFKTAKMNNALRDLKTLGLSKDKIKQIQNGDVSSITAKDVDRAAWRMARLTQFRATPLDLPLFASSDYGRLLYQFKTFSINISKLGWHHFVKPAARFIIPKKGRPIGTDGTIAPLAVFLASSWGVGEIVGSIRSAISGRERPDYDEEFLKRVFDSLWWAGTFGAYSDMYTAIMTGKAFETLLGPGIGGSGAELFELIQQTPEALENEELLELLKKKSLEQIPVVGQMPKLKKQILEE